MKILHIAAHLGGGIGKAHAAMAPHFPRDVEQTFAVLEPPIDTRHVDAIRATGGRVVFAQPSLAAQFAREADVVQIEFWGHPVLDAILKGWRWPSGPPSVCWCHVSGMHAPFVSKTLIACVDRFVATSPITRAALPVVKDMQVINSGFGFDGRRLCVIETVAEQAEDFATIQHELLISTSILKAVCALSKAMGGKLFPWIAFENRPGSKQVFIELIGGNCFVEIESGVVEGQFPNWRDVLPSKAKYLREPINDLGLNAEYVGDFAKAAALLESKTTIVQMNLVGKDSCIEVKINDKPNFYGLVMPCKVDESVDYQPQFVAIEKYFPKVEPKKAAAQSKETPGPVAA